MFHKEFGSEKILGARTHFRVSLNIAANSPFLETNQVNVGARKVRPKFFHNRILCEK